jgi:hypothetical protein
MPSRLSAETSQNAGIPLLLIDIDGVISLWGGASRTTMDGRWTLVDGIPHFLAAAPARRLRGLGGRYELVWCSGWEEKANEYLPELVGLGPLPHLGFDRAAPDGRPVAHWKLGAIDAHAGPDRALAWVDDAFNDACHRWARERPGPTLLVTTRPEHGLTQAQADELAAWAAAVGVNPAAA